MRPAKNAKNIRERGLDFELAYGFDFETAAHEIDGRLDYGETRWIATGFIDGRLYKLVYLEITGGIRVVSFRKANKREVKKYVSDH